MQIEDLKNGMLGFAPVSRKKAAFFAKLVVFMLCVAAHAIREQIENFIERGQNLTDYCNNLNFSVFSQNLIEERMPSMTRKRLLYLSMVKLCEECAESHQDKLFSIFGDEFLSKPFLEKYAANKAHQAEPAQGVKTMPKRDAHGRFIKG